MVAGVLDGTYRCPTLSTLLDASIDTQFDQLIGPAKEMRFWEATMNHASKSNAAKPRRSESATKNSRTGRRSGKNWLSSGGTTRPLDRPRASRGRPPASADQKSEIYTRHCIGLRVSNPSLRTSTCTGGLNVSSVRSRKEADKTKGSGDYRTHRVDGESRLVQQCARSCQRYT